jgi:hypothetical protein
MAPITLWGYAGPMDNEKLFFKAGKPQFILGAIFAGMLTGAIGCSRPAVVVDEQSPPVQSPPAQTTVVVQDDYVYYPGYEVYYSRTRHQYFYPEGGVWVSRPAPRGVSVDVLLASPSVVVDFHDSPASHHAEMVQKYPKNWAPSGSSHGQTDSHKDDDHRNK